MVSAVIDSMQMSIALPLLFKRACTAALATQMKVAFLSANPGDVYPGCSGWINFQ